MVDFVGPPATCGAGLLSDYPASILPASKLHLRRDALASGIEKIHNPHPYHYNNNWSASVGCDYNDSGTLQRWFAYGNGIYPWGVDEVLLMKAEGSEYYYIHDHLYSPAALTDSNGTVLERYEYDAYGKATIRDAQYAIRDTSLYENPYLFTGRRGDILDSRKCQYAGGIMTIPKWEKITISKMLLVAVFLSPSLSGALAQQRAVPREGKKAPDTEKGLKLIKSITPWSAQFRIAADPGKDRLIVNAAAKSSNAEVRAGKDLVANWVPIVKERAHELVNNTHLVTRQNEGGQWHLLVLVNKYDLTDQDISTIRQALDRYGKPAFEIDFKEESTAKLLDMTTANTDRYVAEIINGYVYAAPQIKQPIQQGIMITGDLTKENMDAIRQDPRFQVHSATKPPIFAVTPLSLVFLLIVVILCILAAILVRKLCRTNGQT